MPAVVTITDPSGTAWPLDGSLGLWPMAGRKGFHAPGYQHFRDESPAVDGAFWRGVRALPRDLFVPVFIGGQDRNAVKALQRDLIKSISPRNGECLITVAYPDGSDRSIAARYADGMEAGEQGPGAWGVTALKYGLHFVADDPYFTGDPIQITYGLVASSRLELPIPGADTFYEVVGSDLLTSDVSGPPINANTDFEVNTTGWTGVGGTLTRDVVMFYDGIAAAKLVPDGVTASVHIDSDAYAVTPGVIYNASGWLACAVSRSIALTINWYTAGMVLLSTSTSSATVAAGAFTLFSTNGQAPPTAAFARTLPVMTGTPPGSNILWADDMVLKQTGGIVVTNPGDLDAYPLWRANGPFTAVTAQHPITGKSWTISYSAGSGDSLFLDTRPGKTSLTSTDGTNRWSSLTAGYQLWPLLPGDNVVNVIIVGATSASTAQLNLVPRYESD